MIRKFTIYNLQFTIFLLAFSIIHFTLYILHSPTARAETLSSDNYKIQMDNINMSAKIPTSSAYHLEPTSGTSPSLYSNTGYHAHMGFGYIKNKVPFTFTISDLSIDFGTLTPKTPSTLNNTLIVSSGGDNGYQVTARENNTLKTLAGTSSIADTACDGNACDEAIATPWTQNTTYGFGYNMSGNDIPTTFSGPTYFRPFPSSAASEDPAIVMSSSVVSKNRVAMVTYKVNNSGSQASGDYENYIIFVATPTY